MSTASGAVVGTTQTHQAVFVNPGTATGHHQPMAPTSAGTMYHSATGQQLFVPATATPQNGMNQNGLGATSTWTTGALPPGFFQQMHQNVQQQSGATGATPQASMQAAQMQQYMLQMYLMQYLQQAQGLQQQATTSQHHGTTMAAAGAHQQHSNQTAGVLGAPGAATTGVAVVHQHPGAAPAGFQQHPATAAAAATTPGILPAMVQQPSTIVTNPATGQAVPVDANGFSPTGTGNTAAQMSVSMYNQAIAAQMSSLYQQFCAAQQAQQQQQSAAGGATSTGVAGTSNTASLVPGSSLSGSFVNQFSFAGAPTAPASCGGAGTAVAPATNGLISAGRDVEQNTADRTEAKSHAWNPAAAAFVQSSMNNTVASCAGEQRNAPSTIQEQQNNTADHGVVVQQEQHLQGMNLQHNHPSAQQIYQGGSRVDGTNSTSGTKGASGNNLASATAMTSKGGNKKFPQNNSGINFSGSGSSHSHHGNAGNAGNTGNVESKNRYGHLPHSKSYNQRSASTATLHTSSVGKGGERTNTSYGGGNNDGCSYNTHGSSTTKINNVSSISGKNLVHKNRSIATTHDPSGSTSCDTSICQASPAASPSPSPLSSPPLRPVDSSTGTTSGNLHVSTTPGGQHVGAVEQNKCNSKGPLQNVVEPHATPVESSSCKNANSATPTPAQQHSRMRLSLQNNKLSNAKMSGSGRF